ncbi:MAG: ribonuclease P protein component [Bacteroidales bacterium]|jgi:ribonuclease P protein component|nr:ribonuclease P protein component [Bacteroidales bacterium]
MTKIEERYTFAKEERVTGAKRVDAIFASGKSFISYPLRVVYLQHEQSPIPSCSILISVPKKRMKKAVHRNRVKRLVREAYRLNKKLTHDIDISEQSLDIAFIYVKDTASTYAEIEKAMLKALKQIAIRIKKTEDSEQAK